AGCDRLTIGPSLLEELANSTVRVEQKLTAVAASKTVTNTLTESEFRWEFNQDPMAVDKLAEGIRNFAIDQDKLEVMLRQQLTD
ncbi:MAG: transaldolase, partial [Shewanella sp.]|nr:transaldolase [Shewanella sp.]